MLGDSLALWEIKPFVDAGGGGGENTGQQRGSPCRPVRAGQAFNHRRGAGKHPVVGRGQGGIFLEFK